MTSQKHQVEASIPVALCVVARNAASVSDGVRLMCRCQPSKRALAAVIQLFSSRQCAVPGFSLFLPLSLPLLAPQGYIFPFGSVLPSTRLN